MVFIKRHLLIIAGLLILWGLANLEIARAILGKYYTSEFIDMVTRKEGAKIAVVYDDLARMYKTGEIPKSWNKVGWWQIPDNVICHNSEVPFYAIDLTEKEYLRLHLIEYNQLLPEAVAYGLVEE